MTTYEEDVVEIYYNLQDYFAIKNILFPAIKKRKGGKGRGEIDVLAVKVKDQKVLDAVHIEVGVSLTSSFPFTSKSGIDESAKLLKKFFQNDSEYKIKELIGKTKCRKVVICGKFDKESVNRLKIRIPKFGGKVINIKEKDKKLFLKIRSNGEVKNIEIIPFNSILSDVKQLFKKKKLENKNFQDSRYRAIHYLINHRSL